MAGAPKGNTNASKGKAFYSALRRALARKGKTVDGGLNKVAGQLVAAALNGEQWAIKEIADRIDGKPAQTNILEGNEDSPLIHKIVTELVKPKPTDE